MGLNDVLIQKSSYETKEALGTKSSNRRARMIRGARRCLTLYLLTLLYNLHLILYVFVAIRKGKKKEEMKYELKTSQSNVWTQTMDVEMVGRLEGDQ